MGFFGFIETFFFISLAITFILIMLLVHHFKQRLNDVETKTDNMVEIMNNLLKEMKVMKTMVIEQQQQQPPNMYFKQEQNQELREPETDNSPKPPQFGNLFDMIMPFLNGANHGENPMDMSFLQRENEGEHPIKIITLDKENEESINIDDIENIDVDELESCSNNEELIEEELIEEEDINESEDEPLDKINYKSLDMTQLKALALERGIDPSKKKKAELIQLLQ